MNKIANTIKSIVDFTIAGVAVIGVLTLSLLISSLPFVVACGILYLIIK